MNTTSQFAKLLQDQIAAEFKASQQYMAIAIWYDRNDLPRLASNFYQQSLEERNHALMMVQYLLDRDLDVAIPGIDTVINEFAAPLECLKLALTQEEAVTKQIETLFAAARAESDALGEQFMLWFLKEQVEEVATMNTLVTIAERAGDDWFKIEQFLTHETVGEGDGADPSAPSVAGGAL